MDLTKPETLDALIKRKDRVLELLKRGNALLVERCLIEELNIINIKIKKHVLDKVGDIVG